MVLEYMREISTTLISFGYSNSLEILIAIFTIVTTIILGLFVRSNRANKQTQKGDQNEEENDEIIRQGLQARFKQAQHKILEENLSSEDRDQEKERELQALTNVMKLLQDRKDLFPESSMDDLKQQLNLYRTQ